MKLMHPNSAQEIEVNDNVVGRYASQGWRPIADDAPKKGASLAEWQQYAESKGFSAEDAEGMTRAELRAALA